MLLLYSKSLISSIFVNLPDMCYLSKNSTNVSPIDLNKIFYPFACRVTFLSSMVHRQSKVFVACAIALCKTFSYWLFNSILMHRNIARRPNCDEGLCKDGFANYQ